MENLFGFSLGFNPGPQGTIVYISTLISPTIYNVIEFSNSSFARAKIPHLHQLMNSNVDENRITNGTL